MFANKSGRVPNDSSTQRPTGSLLAAAGSYLCWGLFPLYWRLLAGVDAVELIAHRVVWSLVFLLAIVALQKRLPEFVNAFRNSASVRVHLLSSTLLTVNWLVYVWGVNTGHVIECSLGYFLVPLLNVGLGCWLLREHLRRAQGVAIALAAAGVAVLVWRVGRVPWIALTVALTFGFYGLLRKRSSLGPVIGLALETALLLPLGAGFLVWRATQHTGALGNLDTGPTLILLSAGVVTSIPLILFAKGARGLRMVTLGLLQYLAPTCQFLLGWLLYHEAMDGQRTMAFALIWGGLVVYSVDAVVSSRAQKRQAA
jgi:chloramphenicol-sensitive protein RarD